MTRADTLEILRQIKPTLIQQFGITRLALFGSTARNEALKNSDIDILVAFEGFANSKRYFGLQFYLEDSLKCDVDLVTDNALRPQLRPFIEQEAIDV